MSQSTATMTPATPVTNSPSSVSDMPYSQASTQMSTPSTSYDSINDNKLPFQTTYEEYEKFISKIPSISSTAGAAKEQVPSQTSNVSASPQTPVTTLSAVTIPNPQAFAAHLEAVSHLQTRLNYRFLELEAKLRFLRLLTAGTELSSAELVSLETDSEQLSLKIDNLEQQVQEMKKMGRILRKKIGKCFHQSEIRRCIEGRPILEGEINAMIEKILEHKTFFEQNGMEYSTGQSSDPVEWAKEFIADNILGVDLLETNLNRITSELDELEKTFLDLKSTSESISKQEEDIDFEIEALQKEKCDLEKQLSELSTHESTPREQELIKQHEMLTELVKIWESL